MKHLTNAEVVSKIEWLASEERRVTTECLKYLREVDRRQIYSELGYPSLWAFCVKHLRYTDGAAYRRINSMRMLQEHPEVEEKILSGELNVSTISSLQSFARREEKSQAETKALLRVIEQKSRREVDRLFAALAPEAPRPEKERQITATQAEIRVTLDESLMQKLEKLRSLLSHKNPNPSYVELIEMLADIALKRLDPEQKKERKKQNAPIAQPTAPPPAEPTREPRVTQSRYISARTRRQVWQRDGGKCVNCGTAHQLELDHVIPYAQGGSNEPENLRLLCKRCNQHHALKAYGARKMSQHLPRLL